MLYPLPLEINLHIAKFLSISELLKCSEVCRDWNSFIRSNVKIQMLEMTSPNAFNSTMIAAEKKYINGNQVTSLITSYDFDEGYYAVEIFTRVFPNMRSLKVERFSFIDLDGFLQLRKIRAYKKWESCLETLHMAGSVPELRLLLETCQFERLTDLCVTFSIFDFDERRNNKFMAGLHHLSTLQTMTINGGIFTLEILQYITSNYPPLTHLRLQTGGTGVGDPFNVVPDIISQFPLTLESFRNMLACTRKAHVDALDHTVTTERLPNLTEISTCIPSSLDSITLPYLYSKEMFSNITALHVKANILESHSSLKEITLDTRYTNLTVSENYSNREYLIEKLSLRAPMLTHIAMTFIREAMSYLTSLTIPSDNRFMKIITLIQDINAMEPLSLPNHHLEELRIHSTPSRIYGNSIVAHIQSDIGHINYFYDCKKHKMAHYRTELVGFETDENGL